MKPILHQQSLIVLLSLGFCMLCSFSLLDTAYFKAESPPGGPIPASLTQKASPLDLELRPEMLPPEAWSFSVPGGSVTDFKMRLYNGGLVVLEIYHSNGSLLDQQAFNSGLGDLTYDIDASSSGNLPVTVKVLTCPEYVQYITARNQQWESLDVANLTHLERLQVDNNNISGTVDIQACAATLTILELTNNSIAQLDIDPIATYQVLSHFVVYHNQLNQNLDFSNFPALLECKISSLNGPHTNVIPHLFFGNGTPNMTHLWAAEAGIKGEPHPTDPNQALPLDLTGCTQIQVIRLHHNLLSSIDLAGLKHISRLYIQNNQISDPINISASRAEIGVISIQYNQIQTITLGAAPFPLLEGIDARENLLNHALDFTGSLLLRNIHISLADDGNAITELHAENCPNLENIYAQENAITNDMDLTGCDALIHINLSDNAIQNLDVTGLDHVRVLKASQNMIGGILDIRGFSTMESFIVSHNQLTGIQIDASTLDELTTFHADQNLLPEAGTNNPIGNLDQLIQQVWQYGDHDPLVAKAFHIHNNPGLTGLTCDSKIKTVSVCTSCSCSAPTCLTGMPTPCTIEDFGWDLYTLSF